MAIWVDEHAGQGGGGGGSTPSKVSWGDIENKPETFKPEEHTHIIENIEGLSYQLEGKVSKKDGYSLSQENYTPEEKLKLGSIPPEISKGFVSTVNGKQGEVTLDKSAVGLDLVDNVQQASKDEFVELESKVTTIEEDIKKIPAEFVTTVNGESGEVTVNKEAVGLSNVIDEKQATKDEFDSYKTSNDTELIAIKEGVNINKESIDNLNEKIDSLPIMPEEVVTSVSGKTGDVNLTKEDVGLTNVTNNEQATKVEFDEAIGSLNALISQNTQSITENKDTIESTQTQLESKVDKVAGKQLSTNDFTNIHREKLENLKESTVLSVNSKTGNVTIGKADIGLANVIDEKQATKAEFDTLNIEVKRNTANIALKVDKVEGKQLSTNDFTDEYKTKIETNSNEIDAIKEQINNELPKEVQANRESSLEQPNLKNIIISTTEPEEKYEGLIWIKPLVEGV